MPEWLNAPEIKYFHRVLIEEHGGLQGIRDEGALEATLARPRNLLAYDPDVSLFRLAACYGIAFAKNHVFADGNKRIALTAMNVFLQINGARLAVSEVEATVVVQDAAAGELGEPELAEWVARHAVPFELDKE